MSTIGIFLKSIFKRYELSQFQLGSCIQIHTCKLFSFSGNCCSFVGLHQPVFHICACKKFPLPSFNFTYMGLSIKLLVAFEERKMNTSECFCDLLLFFPKFLAKENVISYSCVWIIFHHCQNVIVLVFFPPSPDPIIFFHFSNKDLKIFFWSVIGTPVSQLWAECLQLTGIPVIKCLELWGLGTTQCRTN